jgi:predicted Fe-Mo cluster-binding NifX family protein
MNTIKNDSINLQGELKVLTKDEFIKIDTSNIIIDMEIYNISIENINYELIEYITSMYGINFAQFKTKYLLKLFKDRFFMNEAKIELNDFDAIYKELLIEDSVYTTLKDMRYITTSHLINTLYKFINRIFQRYNLFYCNITDIIYCGFHNIPMNYYDEDSVLFQCLKGILDNNEDYILYDDSYYHIDNCREGYIDYKNTELIPTRYLYEYCGDYYTKEALCEHNLIYYHGDIYDRDDFVYCEDSGNEIHVDDAFYCDSTEAWYEYEDSIKERNGLKGYHQSEIKDKSNNSEYKIGFEIEKEDDYFSDFSKLRDFGFDAERDGSLNDEGFEIISPIYDLMNMDSFNSDMNNIKSYIDAEYSSNCGGHINVSIIGKEAAEIFELIKGYLPLLYAMYPNRIENRFCKAKKVNEFNDSERYEAINFTKGHILEFRIFSAVKNVNNLRFRYKLIQYMFKNQRKGAASVIRMLLTDSELKEILLSVYSLEKYNLLTERAIKYTDIYMSQRDVKTTSNLITKMKQGQMSLEELINN